MDFRFPISDEVTGRLALALQSDGISQNAGP